MNKDFDNWNILKKKLDDNINYPSFKEREIWWCHTGVNIGDEECGKGVKSHRPVLILRKFNNKIFTSVPLTTAIKNNYFYFQISFQDKRRCLMLSHLKVIDAKRLDRKISYLSKEQFFKVKEEIRRKAI